MKKLKIAVAAASLCAIAMSPVANAQFAPPPPPPLDPVMLGVGGLALGAVAGLAVGSLGGDAGSSGSPGATVTPTVTAAPVTVTPTVTAGAATVTPTVTAPARTTTPTVTAGAVTVTATATQTVTETVTAAPVTSTPRVTAPAVTVTPTRTAAPVTVTPTRTAAAVTTTPTRTASPTTVTSTVVVTETATKTVTPPEVTPPAGDKEWDGQLQLSLLGSGRDEAGNPAGHAGDSFISEGEVSDYRVWLFNGGGDGIGTFDVTINQDPDIPLVGSPRTSTNGCTVTSATRSGGSVRVRGACTQFENAWVEIWVKAAGAPTAGTPISFNARFVGTDKLGNPIHLWGRSTIDGRTVSDPVYSRGLSPYVRTFDSVVSPR